MKKIIQKNNPVLRKIAMPILIKEITSQKIKNLLKDMKEAMYGEDDSVGIAAPQIGVSLRAFLVSGKVFAKPKEEGASDEEYKNTWGHDLVCINPEIIKSSQKENTVEEGCLSVRWLYGKLKRAEKVTLRAYDGDGKLFTRGASGLLSQIFQHEVDHLNGVLFIDKAKNIQEMPPGGRSPQ